MKLQKENLARRLGLPLLLAGSLVIAGCSGETPTTAPQNTDVVSATEPVATEVVAATDVPTEAATTAPTTAPETQQPAATVEGTAAVGTPGAGETAMPGVNEVEQVLVQSSNLIGMNIQALDGLTLGTIRDVLVDQTGRVKSRLLCFDIRAGESSRGDEHLLFGK